MSVFFSQEARMGRLNTVLGTDVLVLQRFSGTDHLNALFDYQVDCLASVSDIDFDALIGTHASVILKAQDGSEQPFDGIVTEARWLGAGDNGHKYRLRLQPWFFLASLRRNQRIFHNKTVVEILNELLSSYADAGGLQIQLSEEYPELEYTVQYRESDMDFATRMMERHGISYRFTHSEGMHSLVLSDMAEIHESLGERPFKPDDGHHQEETSHFWDWHPARRITTGAIRLTDYNFKTPNAAMETDHIGDADYAQGQIESFDWPGDYLDQGRGQLVSRVRTKGERGQDRRYEAVGDVLELRGGIRVTLSGDPVPGHGNEYICLSATHSYTSDNYGSGGSAGDGYAYSGHYVLMPTSAPMMPELKTPRADVRGPQTAKVVGEGEIDCDEYGRILVQFHWDLDGAYSMRCRVSQSWAGNGWGGMVIPRIGMEVVVEFLDGDPDKPLVTGCVYNGKNAVPYDLPANKTRSTFRTDTHQGTGFNEFRFEDKKDEEEIFVHGQKDHNTKIENNLTERINVNKVESVGHSRASEVTNHRYDIVGGDMELSIGPAQAGRFTPSGADDMIEGISGVGYGLGSKGKVPRGEGNFTINVEQDLMEAIGRNHSARIGRNRSEMITKSYYLDIGEELQVDVGKRIILKCGDSQIMLLANGNIAINGKVINQTADELIKLLADVVKIN